MLFKSWEPAWDLWSKWGPFLWAVAADLMGDRPGGNLQLEVIYELPLMVALTAILALVKSSISLRNEETECGVLCDWSTFFSPKEKCRCPSHIRIAWILYFPHLYVLLFILQYLLEDMIERFSGEFICILQQKSASHSWSHFLWYVSHSVHIWIYMQVFIFFILFV